NYMGHGGDEGGKLINGRLLVEDPTAYPIELSLQAVPFDGPAPRIGDRVEYETKGKTVTKIRKV
ncbi:MAG TPA: hypothetical protein VJK52_03540, partial [Candidatus Nanoarchaeia archaeon]|nr:hypothetical protein [Candidatus Nanoarchaeia archaeon]